MAQLFPSNKRFVPDKKTQPNLKHPTEEHLQASCKKLAWKRCLETNQTNLLAQKIWRPGEFGCQITTCFPKPSHPICTEPVIHCSVEHRPSGSRFLSPEGKLRMRVELFGLLPNAIT
jgi:hypothetical protein